MAGKLKILGVHPVTAREPVYLVEIELEQPDQFDFGQVTQEIDNQPEADWQVAYDEREVEVGDGKRFAFFFHYLNTDKPLRTSFGLVKLPLPTPIPTHLKHIVYEEP